MIQHVLNSLLLKQEVTIFNLWNWHYPEVYWNDFAVNFGQFLIQEKLSKVRGLRSVVHSGTLTYKLEKGALCRFWIVMIHTGYGATDIDCKQKLVKVYDS